MCNFGDSAYELNDLLFAFKSGIGKYKVKFMLIILNCIISSSGLGRKLDK